MAVIGLDLSSVNSGYAIFDDNTLVEYGSIIPDGKLSHADKLRFIYTRISELCEAHRITVFSIEDQHFRKNMDTLKLLSRICGVAMLAASQHGAEVALYPPTTIKLCFTGNGKAEKKDMIARAIEVYNLDRQKIDDNIADAIGVAYTYLNKGTEENRKPKGSRKKTTRRRPLA